MVSMVEKKLITVSIVVIHIALTEPYAHKRKDLDAPSHGRQDDVYARTNPTIRRKWACGNRYKPTLRVTHDVACRMKRCSLGGNAKTQLLSVDPRIFIVSITTISHIYCSAAHNNTFTKKQNLKSY